MLRKLITIWGTSFSGSTLLAHILGSLPGTKNVGEVNALLNPQWLLKKGADICSVCSPGTCPFFTYEFIQSLDERNIYENLSKRLNCSTLITSEKNDFNYRKTLPHVKASISAVVIFKDPFSYYYSCKKRNQLSPTLNGTLNIWRDIYLNTFKYLRLNGHSYVVIEYRNFANATKRYVKNLCKKLDLRFDESALDYWDFEHHQIGGNNTAHLNLWKNPGKERGRIISGVECNTPHYRENKRKIKSNEDWIEGLSIEEKKSVAKYKIAWRYYNQLRDLQYRTIGFQGRAMTETGKLI